MYRPRGRPRYDAWLRSSMASSSFLIAPKGNFAQTIVFVSQGPAGYASIITDIRMSTYMRGT